MIVAVLKGSFVFLADLVRAMNSYDLMPTIEFIRLRSYGAQKQSDGAVHLLGEIPENLDGKQVLILDDIIDSGHSLVLAKSLLEDRGAGSIRTCVLLDKPSRRQVECAADFVGFTIEDVFVVGYGLDYDEQYRHLPYIGVVE